LVVLSSDGSFTYTPATGYSGPDSFTYKANDGTVDSNTATVSITVNSVPVSITITSSLTGSNFVEVDGTPITTPQTFDWLPGSTHTLAANSPVSGGTGIQYVYSDWGDGGNQVHDYTVPGSSTTVTANYDTQYQVTFSAGTGGSINQVYPSWPHQVGGTRSRPGAHQLVS
jgi:hypothetical protein